jgi:hypothetical protein
MKLQKILDESIAEFNEKAAEAEKELDYTVVPIKKLAAIQLLTALYAMDYVRGSPIKRFCQQKTLSPRLRE